MNVQFLKGKNPPSDITIPKGGIYFDLKTSTIYLKDDDTEGTIYDFSNTAAHANSATHAGTANSAIQLTDENFTNGLTIGDTNKPIYFKNGIPTLLSYELNKNVPSDAVFTDTTNTTGAGNTNSKIYLVGAITQDSSAITYSHDTAYVGTDGCLYSNDEKVLTGQSVTNHSGTLEWDTEKTIAKIGNTDITVKLPTNPDTNYYHTTGKWSGLTYTATSNGGAGELKFTLPTGTSVNTVATGNHDHDDKYLPFEIDSSDRIYTEIDYISFWNNVTDEPTLISMRDIYDILYNDLSTGAY